MKLFRCDWCDEVKACRTMAIDSTHYDICDKCAAKIAKKLDGKGESMPAPFVLWPVIYPPTYVPYEPPSPRWVTPQPHWPDNSPIITCKANTIVPNITSGSCTTFTLQ